MMKTMHTLQRLQQMDQLIRLKATGSPRELAARLGISKSSLYNYLDLLRMLGGPVSYNPLVSSMRNLIFVNLCIVFFSHKSYSQDSLGYTIPIGKVTYSHQVPIGESPSSRNGIAELLFNSNRSVYIHLGDPNEKGEYYPDPNGVLIKQVGGDKQGAPIYKMHPERRMLYRDVCIGGNGRCIVSDTFGAIDWVLQPERKRFGLYDCHRATGTFHGREYEVWYTLDIPVSSGPFKLGGLPGLILEARTTDGTANFLFMGIEISKKITDRIKPPFGKDSGLSYGQYQQGLWDFSLNKISELKAQGIEITLHLNPDALELWQPEK